ncbi:hypothetical protein GCM10020254_41980 [Streptomyces goshikiensis]
MPSAPSALAGRPDPVVGGWCAAGSHQHPGRLQQSSPGCLRHRHPGGGQPEGLRVGLRIGLRARAPFQGRRVVGERAGGAGPQGARGAVPPRRTSGPPSRCPLQLLNAERAAVGRPPLALRQDLSDFARKWAEHMRTSGFSHSSSEERAYLKTGTRTWTGENIVWFSDASMTAQEAAEKFQSMWRHSPGHYKAQVSPDFTEVGVGLHHDSSGWWGVHNFSDGR